MNGMVSTFKNSPNYLNLNIYNVQVQGVASFIESIIIYFQSPIFSYVTSITATWMEWLVHRNPQVMYGP